MNTLRLLDLGPLTTVGNLVEYSAVNQTLIFSFHIPALQTALCLPGCGHYVWRK